MGKCDSYWLAAPLVTSGTVVEGCVGCFRDPKTTDVLLDRQNELQLLTVAPACCLVPLFKQPLFCGVRHMQVLPFSRLQASHAVYEMWCCMPSCIA